MTKPEIPTPFDRVRDAVERMRAAGATSPDVAVVLGSGAGEAELPLEDAVSRPYAELPGFAPPSVDGHVGCIEIGRCAGVATLLLRGRLHAYEGLAPPVVLHPVRVAAALGARTLVVTSAVGSLRVDLPPGALVLVEDHVDVAAPDPLAGPHDERFGPRFVDLTGAYDPALRDLARTVAERRGLDLPGVVYGRMLGPTYETPAEVRALGALGVDVVGMSLVPEVVAARQAGLRVLALAIVTNRAAGLGGTPPDHREVLAVGRDVGPRLTDLLRALLPDLAGRAT